MARRKRGPADRPSGRERLKTTHDAAPPDRLRPWLLAGACALFVARPLVPSESAAAEGDGIPVVMLWLALAVAWLLGAIGRREFRVRFGWIDAAVLLLVVLNVLAAVYGAISGSPRPAVNMLWEWVGLGLGFFLVRQFMVGPGETRALAVVMIALATALSGFGLYQYFYEMPATRAAYQRDPEKMLREADLDFLADPKQRRAFEDRLNSPEPMATFALTNSLAGVLAPWLVFVAGVGVGRWKDGRPHPLPLSRERERGEVAGWIGIALSAVLVSGCLILTMSRSAYLATVMGFALLGVWAGRQAWRNWRLLAAAGLVLAALVGIGVATRGVDASIFSQAAKSLGYRLHYWQSTLAMIADHPWLGVGPGNFQAAYTVYKLPQAVEEVAEPHNFLLEVGATAGAPAMLVLVLALGALGWKLIQATRRAQDSTEGLSGNGLESPPPTPARSARGPMFAMVGGAIGFPLAMVVGLLASVTPTIAGLAIGLALAVATMALLADWVNRGRLPPLLPGLAILVLLVNLLAAGGIGFPGVAGTLWLLAALGLSAAERLPGSGDRRFGRRVGLVLLGTTLLLVIGCYATAYSPVLECRAWMRAARRTPEQQQQCWLRAAAADRLAARPWEYLAQDAFLRWQIQPNPVTLAQFEQYTVSGLSRSPDVNAAWSATGDRYLAVYRATSERRYLEESLAAYRKAVELYPHNAEHQAKLALALRDASDESGFREHAETALWLDEVTPHPGSEPLAELRKELQRNVSRK